MRHKRKFNEIKCYAASCAYSESPMSWNPYRIDNKGMVSHHSTLLYWIRISSAPTWYAVAVYCCSWIFSCISYTYIWIPSRSVAAAPCDGLDFVCGQKICCKHRKQTVWFLRINKRMINIFTCYLYQNNVKYLYGCSCGKSDSVYS